MGGNLCSCTSGRMGKAASQDNLYSSPTNRPNGYRRGPYGSGMFAPPSTDPLMTSSPCSSARLLDATNPVQLSQSTLDESGISSKASSCFEESTLTLLAPGVHGLPGGSPRSYQSSSAPSTPQMIRRKPPPKPPRMRSQYSSTGTCEFVRTPSPSVKSKGFDSLKSSLADVTSSLDSPVPTYDGTVVFKNGPQLIKDKVYHILMQTREFLMYEISPEKLLDYLFRRGVISTKSVEELRRCKTKYSMCELLLDIITSKGHEEFMVLCDALRTAGKQTYLADLLLVLDQLIEAVTSNGRHGISIFKDSKDANCSSGYSSEADGSRYNLGCPVCTSNNNNGAEDGVNDAASFDIEISYFDTESGHMKTTKDIATIKRKKKKRLSEADDSFSSYNSLDNTDRYVPVISVSLFNQCLFSEGMDMLAGILDKYSCVRELSIAKNHIGLPEICRLGKALERNRGLVKLDIRLNSIGDEGARHLADGLRLNSSMRVLNATSTGLSGTGCNLLVQGISRNAYLTELDVGFNDLQDVGCEAISDMLSKNVTNLRKLRMRDNSITSRGARLIFKALKRNSRLATLDISSNNLSDSVTVLGDILLCNRALREVNLENCKISKNGCVALARALKTNTTLKQLDMSMNPLKDEGVDALSEGLKYNQVLDVLCLNMCYIGNRGFLELLNALRFNGSMGTVKLCYNEIGQAGTDQSSSSIPTSLNSSRDQDDTEDSDITPLAVPPIDDLYDKLCQTLQLNKNLKVLLWGNKLDEPDDPFASPSSSESTHTFV